MDEQDEGLDGAHLTWLVGLAHDDAAGCACPLCVPGEATTASRARAQAAAREQLSRPPAWLLGNYYD